MQLSLDTKILDLTRDYPFLIENLAQRNKAFAKLKNPILRKTLGRVASVGKAASLGAENPLELLLFIAGRIMAATGEEVSIKPPDVLPGNMPQKAISGEERLKALKEIVMSLHDGAELASLQKKFNETVGDITPEEIAALEQSLVNEGLPESEIKRLCNLHVELFKGALAGQERPQMAAGHPVHTYMQENERAAEIAEHLGEELSRMGEEPNENVWAFTVNQMRSLLTELKEIHTHYVRKENQLFPSLEAHAIEAPTKVMWEVHDDIRGLFKEAEEKLQEFDRTTARASLHALVTAVKDMIYKEEQILFPMALETLSEEEWQQIRRGDDEIGYAFGVKPGSEWQAPVIDAAGRNESTAGLINLSTGGLSPEVIDRMLCSLPVDMSFVGSDDRVAYYTESPHRIFPRSPAVIGRDVHNCHPPKSVHMVSEILEKFKSGERDNAEFWLELGGKFIHIQYVALRSLEGKYLGCLEVGQDATHVRSLTGQRRLLEWE